MTAKIKLYVLLGATHLRYVISLPLSILWTILCCWATLIAVVTHVDREKEQLILYWWGRGLMILFNVTVKVLGKENLSDQGTLLLFNHTSLFDIPALFASTKKVVRFGAKAELFKIPIFGAAMSRVGILPIARQNRAEVFRIYQNAQQRVNKGESFILAPESSRMEKPEIGPFKSGPFIFAIQSEIPITPVVLKGAYEILPKNSFVINAKKWHSEITIQFLPLIHTKGLHLTDRDEIKHQVRNLMVDWFNRKKNTASF